MEVKEDNVFSSKNIFYLSFLLRLYFLLFVSSPNPHITKEEPNTSLTIDICELKFLVSWLLQTQFSFLELLKNPK